MKLKKKIINVLKFVFFLAAGLFLFWIVYKDQDFEQLSKALKNIDYLWIIFGLILGIISHLIRAIRWQMLAHSLDYKPSFINSFLSVMVGYLVNLGIPRMGEVSRAAVIKRYEKIPFSQSFGTIVLERIIDLLILILLTAIVFIFRYDLFVDFLNNNPAVGEKFRNINFSNTFLILTGSFIVLGVFLMIVLRNQLRKTLVYQKTKDLLKKFIQGLKSVGSLKSLPLFLIYSFLIWLMYYLMLYICFDAFDFTSDLGLWAALVVFVFGSYGMVAPVQGGIGAWHFMVIGTLFLFGIQDADARVFALVVHGSQTLMLLVVGLLSLLALPIINKR
ncbi:MAG: lysylphosphatidylglycerol synthase transmembrane domain-containing protein [Marinilabiliales bacterium]